MTILMASLRRSLRIKRLVERFCKVVIALRLFSAIPVALCEERHFVQCVSSVALAVYILLSQ